MPIFFFSVRNGEHADVRNDGAEFPNHSAAWKEMTDVWSNMVGEVSRTLVENAEWRMELLDKSMKPVSRIRLVAETLESSGLEPGRKSDAESSRELQPGATRVAP